VRTAYLRRAGADADADGERRGDLGTGPGLAAAAASGEQTDAAGQATTAGRCGSGERRRGDGGGRRKGWRD